MGRNIGNDKNDCGDGRKISQPVLLIPENDIQVLESYCDLFWWYCKQDVYQSIMGGNQLLYVIYIYLRYLANHLRLPYDYWSRCPPRCPIGSFHDIYGTMDHLVLLMGQIVNFASKDRSRKRKLIIKIIPGTPEDLDLLKAEDEWQNIKKSLEIFEYSLGSEWLPLHRDFVQASPSPFGPGLQYRTYSMCCIWAMLYAAKIMTSRMRPSLPPTAAIAVNIASPETAFWANQVGRICVGLPHFNGQTVGSALSAALKDISFSLYVAGMQYRDLLQRSYTVDTLQGINKFTGFKLSASFAVACEDLWAEMAEMERGLEYEPEMKTEPAIKEELKMNMDSKEHILREIVPTTSCDIDQHSDTEVCHVGKDSYVDSENTVIAKPRIKVESPSSKILADAMDAEHDIKRLKIS